MSQDLTVNVKTTSDVPQAMDKAKQATVSFGKQVDDIQKKFSMAFKDIFLSFLGPMALVGVAINYIGGLIAENQKKQAEANQAAIDGTNKLMSAEDQYWARKMDREKKTKETAEQAKDTREATTKEFLLKDPRGQMLFNELYYENKLKFGKGGFIGSASRDPQIQGQVQYMLSQDIEKNGMILSKEQQDALQKKLADEAAAKVASEAKDLAGLKQLAASSKPNEPAGYGNVIGVGSNIAIEMAQMQIDELKRHTELLQMIATKESVAAVDFSKGDKSNTTPSRAKLLSGK